MKKFLIPIISMSLSIIITAQIYASSDIEKVITYDENGRKVITLIFDPVNTPDLSSMETEEVTKLPVLTEAPEIGTTLGHILNENAPPNAVGSSRFTEAYQSGMIGQCTWYAAGRFREVYGIELPYMQSAKKWIANAYKSNEIKAITDINDIQAQSIAVFKPTSQFEDWAGHVCFIEYVERDKNGEPTFIYYTDANGSGDLTKDIFDIGYDGAVKVQQFEEFKNPYGLELIGYIVPNDEM